MVLNVPGGFMPRPHPAPDKDMTDAIIISYPQGADVPCAIISMGRGGTGTGGTGRGGTGTGGTGRGGRGRGGRGRGGRGRGVPTTTASSSVRTKTGWIMSTGRRLLSNQRLDNNERKVTNIIPTSEWYFSIECERSQDLHASIKPAKSYILL